MFLAQVCPGFITNRRQGKRSPIVMRIPGKEKLEASSRRSSEGRQNVDNQAVAVPVENEIEPGFSAARRWRTGGRKRRWKQRGVRK